MRDWPDDDVLSASLSSSATTMTVADATDYTDNWVVEIDQEALVITSTASTGTAVSIRRAARGTTAATHVLGSVILTTPRFLTSEIITALNEALQAMYPLIYRGVVDETLTGLSATYEYAIPDMPSLTDYPIPAISRIELKDSSDTAFRETKSWTVIRGSAPKIKFRRSLTGGETVRIIGYGPYGGLTALTDELDDQFPRNAEGILVEFAASYLMASKEMEPEGRANKSNAAALAPIFQNPMRASNALQSRFYARLQNAAMPPLPAHIRSVI